MSEKLGETLGDVETKTLVDTLAETLAEVEAETLGDTLGDVEEHQLTAEQRRRHRRDGRTRKHCSKIKAVI